MANEDRLEFTHCSAYVSTSVGGYGNNRQLFDDQVQLIFKDRGESGGKVRVLLPPKEAMKLAQAIINRVTDIYTNDERKR